jgi:hypothetical protein
MTTATVCRTFGKRPDGPEPFGELQASDSDVSSGIVTPLLKTFTHGRAMTPKKLLQTVRERYNPKLTKAAVHSFIGWHLDAVQLCGSVSREETRMAVPRACSEQHIATMKGQILGKFSELVFTFHELGFSEWEDRKPRKVIAPQAISPGPFSGCSVLSYILSASLDACVQSHQPFLKNSFKLAARDRLEYTQLQACPISAVSSFPKR